MSGFQSGELAFASLNGVLVSLVFVWAFLTLYRRAVEKTMRMSAPGRSQARIAPKRVSAEGSPMSAPGRSQARIAPKRVGVEASPTSAPASAAHAPIAPAIAAAPPRAYGAPERMSGDSVRRQLAFAYGASFAISTLALSWPAMVELGREATATVAVVQAMVVWMTHWAPAVILTGFVVAMRPSGVFRAFARLWLIGAVLSVGVPVLVRIATGRSLDPALAMNAVWFTAALALNALPPLLLVFLTGRPRIRNVMPLALALIVLLSFALAFFDHWMKAGLDDLTRVDPVLQWVVIRFGAVVGPALLFLALSLPVGLLAWWALGRVEARYAARRFSDVQLIVDAWWCLVIALHLVTLWKYGASTALGVCAAAFALYFAATRGLLRLLRLPGRTGGPTLLLLRVFGFQRRTERLYDAVAARWRFEGPVAMIAGADLAVRSIDAGEALAFARGEIASGYVADRAGLERRLEELDGPSDPDGRYRVTEFFCYDDTWRATLQSLVARSSVVLMDLRGLTKDNAGCVYELQQLAAAHRLANCVLVVDETSDRAVAESALAGVTGVGPAWLSVRALDGASMNALWQKLVESSAA